LNSITEISRLTSRDTKYCVVRIVWCVLCGTMSALASRNTRDVQNISRYLPRKFAQNLLYKRDFWLYPLCRVLEGLSICSRVYFILSLCLNVCNGGSLGQLMNGRFARQRRAKGLRRRAPRSQMKKSKAAQQKGVRRGCD